MADSSASLMVDRLLVRRVLDAASTDSVVRLRVGGERQVDDSRVTAQRGNDPRGVSAGETDLSIWMLESGAIRLMLGPVAWWDRGLLADPDPQVAALAVSATDDGLRITSARERGFGPDPEDVTIEIGNDPLTLRIVDTSGRVLFRLACDNARSRDDSATAPLVRTVEETDDGHRRGSTSIAFAVEPDERLYGLYDAGPDDRLDLVGTPSVLRMGGDPSAAGLAPDPDATRPRPPLVLSSRGYGLLVHTTATVTIDLGLTSPGTATLHVAEPLLDLFVLPSTWPRTALSNFARLAGLAPVPVARSFGLLLTTAEAAAPAPAEPLDVPTGPARTDERLTMLAALLDEASIAHEPPGPDPTRPSRLEREVAALTHASVGPAFTGVSAPASAPRDPEAMRSTLRHALRQGLATSGFWRANLAASETRPTPPALLARWAQLALLGPLAGFELTDASGAADRSTLFGGWADPSTLAVLRGYVRLRYRLLPYLLHCARETAQTGLPMLRPLLLEHSWDADAVAIDDQFLLGRDLLAAPVFSDSAEPVARRVYLPAYANWYDWWTGTLYEGQQWVETAAPLDRMPIYARAGTVIPVTDVRAAIGEAAVDVTRLLLFAPRDGAIGASVELDEDNMLGVEQERGERKARIFVEGLPGTIRDLEVVGLPSTTRLVDTSASGIAITPGDGDLPGLGATWDSLTIRLDTRAFTAGLELGW